MEWIGLILLGLVYFGVLPYLLGRAEKRLGSSGRKADKSKSNQDGG